MEKPDGIDLFGLTITGQRISQQYSILKASGIKYSKGGH